jgi:hypothetical protein
MGALFLSCIALAACSAEPRWPELKLVQVAGGFQAPVYLTHAEDGRGRLFIVESPRRIRIIQTQNFQLWRG